MIIYTCPECGADLQSFILTSNPPKTQYNCPLCNWSYTEPQGQPEEIIRIPYGGNSISKQNFSLLDLPYYDYVATTPSTSKGVCEFCPTNPRNGGDGICHCILGGMDIKC